MPAARAPHPVPCAACGYPLAVEGAGPIRCTRCRPDGEADIAPPGRPRPIPEFLGGFVSLPRAGVALLTRPEFRGTFAIAVAVNCVLVVSLYLLLVLGLGHLVGRVEWAGWWAWVDEAGAILKWLLALLATWFLAPALINLGLSPFFDPIANAAERRIGGEGMTPVELGLLRNLAAAANASLRILLLQLALLIPVMLLGLLPGIGPLFVLLGALLSSWLNALTWFEIPVLRRGYGYRYRREAVRRNLPRALGLGLAIQLGVLVPLFNLFFLGPAAAVAVSGQFFRCRKPGAVD